VATTSMRSVARSRRTLSTQSPSGHDVAGSVAKPRVRQDLDSDRASAHAIGEAPPLSVAR
jgi:hypothetical protein